MKNELEAVVDLIKSMLHANNKDYLTQKQIDRFGRCLKHKNYHLSHFTCQTVKKQEPAKKGQGRDHQTYHPHPLPPKQ